MSSSPDSKPMDEAKRLLHAEKLSFRQTSLHQLKYGALNFYPDSGTIFRDGDRSKLTERGIFAFIELCRRPNGPDELIDF